MLCADMRFECIPLLEINFIHFHRSLKIMDMCCLKGKIVM